MGVIPDKKHEYFRKQVVLRLQVRKNAEGKDKCPLVFWRASDLVESAFLLVGIQGGDASASHPALLGGPRLNLPEKERRA